MEAKMEAKEASRFAKAYIADLFKDEKVEHVGLEEIEFDENNHVWRVTVGFLRPEIELEKPAIPSMANILASTWRTRDMKVVTINDQGVVLSVRNRE